MSSLIGSCQGTAHNFSDRDQHSPPPLERRPRRCSGRYLTVTVERQGSVGGERDEWFGVEE
jgi:hypothetical protein